MKDRSRVLLGVILGLWAFGVQGAEVVKPALDVPLRDPSVCRGPEGTFYLTGTAPKKSGDGTLDYNNGTAIRLWKSDDLKTWEEVGVVWDLARAGWNERWSTGPRALPGQPDSLRHYLGITAPEIHYLKDTFWIPYCVNSQGTGLLRSKTGKAEGPYEDWGRNAGLTYITAGGADPSMFQDDPPSSAGADSGAASDGPVYWLWSPAWIAEMKDDLTGLAEAPRMLTCEPRVKLAGDVLVGSSGPFLFKADGKYHLAASDTLPRLGINTEDTLVATSDTLFGPYSKREMMIPHGGQTTVFQDGGGNWKATFCGRDRFAAFRDRPGILPLEWMDRWHYAMWRPNNPLLRADPFNVITERGPWQRLRPLVSDKPKLSIRDMNMIQAPDGYFYFTGSVNSGYHDDTYKKRLTIFRSRDLKNWEEIVARTFDDEDTFSEARRKYVDNNWGDYYMDCEIHYLPGQGNFFVFYHAYHPCNHAKAQEELAEADRVGTSGVLRSTTGKGEGPYEKIRAGGVQSGFFEDDDGSLYEYWGVDGLRRLKPDFSKDKDLPNPTRARGGACFEDSGVYMVKMHGKYVFFTCGCSSSNMHWVPQSAANYDFNYMTADSPEGPWSEWMPGVRHGGHGGVFKGLDGHWYGVVWDYVIPGWPGCVPGLVRLTTEMKDGELTIDVDPDWTPDDYKPVK